MKTYQFFSIMGLLFLIVSKVEVVSMWQSLWGIASIVTMILAVLFIGVDGK